MNKVGNVHFTLYGRGHPVSLVTRGQRPQAKRGASSGAKVPECREPAVKGVA